MAGSWGHIVDDDGRFDLDCVERGMIENLGDAWEALEECYGMVQILAGGDAAKIKDAHARWPEGILLGGVTGDGAAHERRALKALTDARRRREERPA